jgi:alkylhydroperoxidase family enzyme
VSRALEIDEDTLADLPRYGESDRFTPLEKAALDLAVAISSTPADVDADLRDRLLAALTPGQFVELASAIAWENHRARLNRALGVESMGFAAGGYCVLPERPAQG